MDKPKRTIRRKLIHPKNINFRVRDDQAERWRVAAEASGMVMSEWMRDTLDRAARKVKLIKEI